MKQNNQYWKDYYKDTRNKSLLNSKLDRSRYYLNCENVNDSINILKNNVNKLNKYKLLSLISKSSKNEFLFYSKKNLTNFDNIKLIFILKTLKRYFKACKFIHK